MEFAGAVYRWLAEQLAMGYETLHETQSRTLGDGFGVACGCHQANENLTYGRFTTSHSEASTSDHAEGFRPGGERWLRALLAPRQSGPVRD